MSDIRTSTLGGIPFGNSSGRPANPGTGQLYSNGEAARLELYTAAGAWENIVQEVPGVSSISGAYNESTGSATITINGTNFVSGAIASAIGTNAIQVEASSTTFNSLVQLTAVFTGLSNANEPYDIKVTNPSNLFGLLPDALYINASPVWSTSAGSLGTFAEQVSMSVSATATDDSTLTYSLASGSTLPSGVTLNSSTGLISGTPPDVASNTTYTFTINASDGVNPVVPRTFSFISNAAPVWVTSAGSLGSFFNNTSITTSALSATDTSDTVTYALASGSSLPAGLALNSSTGVISGTLPVVSVNTTYTFTINASDGLSLIPRTFSISSIYDVAIEYLIVAGGGGTGWDVGGGGGGGGVLSGTSTKVRGTTFAISVGGGGLSHPANSSNSKGNSGGNSSLFELTAIGGGGGGSYPAQGNGRSGGSGGGGASVSENGGGVGQGGSGTSGQGYAGGNDSGGAYGSGGGGGAGGPGANGIVGQSVDGGLPIYSSITGTSTAYSGGGYGNSDSGTVYATGTNRSGTVVGYYGFGANGTGPSGVQANPGVVIIAYPDTIPAITTIPGTLTYDQPSRSGYRVYRFTAGSGTVTF